MDNDLISGLIFVCIGAVLLISIMVSSYVSKKQNAQIEAHRLHIERKKIERNRKRILCEATLYAIEMMEDEK